MGGDDGPAYHLVIILFLELVAEVDQLRDDSDDDAGHDLGILDLGVAEDWEEIAQPLPDGGVVVSIRIKVCSDKCLDNLRGSFLGQEVVEDELLCCFARDAADSVLVRGDALEHDLDKSLQPWVDLGDVTLFCCVRVKGRRRKQMWVCDDDVGKNLKYDFLEGVVAFDKAVKEEVEVLGGKILSLLVC